MSYLVAFLSLALINFVSAKTYSIREGLASIDGAMVVLVSIFLISFILVFLSSSRIFKANKAISGAIALVLAFGITYGINKLDWDIQGLIYDIGIPEETLLILGPILAVAVLVLMIWKLKRDSLPAIGIILIIFAFFVEEQALVLVIGVGFILTRFLLKKKPKASPIEQALKGLFKS